MGVHPEPALCADDVRRLVSDASRDDDRTRRHASRSSTGGNRLVSSNSTLKGFRRLASALVALCCVSAAPTEASAYEPATAARPAEPSDWSIGGAWGDEQLPGRDLTTAIIAMSQADPAFPKSVSGAAIVRFGDRNVPRPLVDTILRAAEATGADPVYMMALADKESSFDTDVKNAASSAKGLFQFVAGTWLEMIRDYGAKHGFAEEAAAAGKRSIEGPMRKRILALRDDPYVAALMAGELIKRDRARIETRIGRELKTTELYIAHFLGTASAGKFLALRSDDPNTPAALAFGGAARANRDIFSGKGGGKRGVLTVAEVHERIDGMIESRMGKFEPVKALAERPQMDEKPGTSVIDARLRIADPAIPTVQ